MEPEPGELRALGRDRVERRGHTLPEKRECRTALPSSSGKTGAVAGWRGGVGPARVRAYPVREEGRDRHRSRRLSLHGFRNALTDCRADSAASLTRLRARGGEGSSSPIGASHERSGAPQFRTNAYGNRWCDNATSPILVAWKVGVRVPSVSSDEVQALIDLLDTPHTPRTIRRSAAALRPVATSSPPRALEELKAVAEAGVATLETHVPSATLYRAVALPTFHRHCTSATWRPPVVSYEIFRREVESVSDPEAFLLDTLDRSGVVFPRAHSWLVEGAAVPSLDGRGLVHGLQLDKQEPPFALCVLTPPRMAQNGVEIRAPEPLDAVLGGHVAWDPSGVPVGHEYVDLDIVGDAIEEILWRP